MMSTFLKLCCLILATATMDAGAIAPERPLKPYFNRLYVEPSGALVAELTSAGFYRSEDGGVRWSRIPSPTDFLQLVSSGLDANGQVCHPQDAGRSWDCLGLSGRVNAVGGTGVLYRNAGSATLEMSADGGEHWLKTTSWSGSSSSPDTSSTIVVQGQAIYAVAQGVYRSGDHGAHWTAVIARRPFGPPFLEMSGEVIGLMSTQDGRLYATTSTSTVTTKDGISIQVSADDGQTWTRQTFGLPATWEYFAVERIFSNTVYFAAAERAIPGEPLGLYRSVDGKTAEYLNINHEYGNFVDMQVGPDSAIYVVTNHFIHRSDDGGKTWRQLGRNGIHPD